MIEHGKETRLWKIALGFRLRLSIGYLLLCGAMLRIRRKQLSKQCAELRAETNVLRAFK